MSKQSLVTIIFLLVLFGAAMVILNESLTAVNDRLFENCPKPAIPSEVEPVFYIAANTPISRGTMVR